MGLAPACGRATSTAPYRSGRGIYAGRVWTNCYRLCSAHAAFGGYKKSGIGREICKMMLDHHQQTKNMLVSYRVLLKRGFGIISRACDAVP
jgi:acyl-CoA reductase-like NAD-dependent aldehyde dehydrogenase